MKRVRRISRKPKALLAAVACLVAAAAIIGTGADWSSSASNLATAQAGGALSIDQSNTGAVLNVSGLSPGSTAQGYLDLTDQTQAAYLSFRQSAASDRDSLDQPVTDPARKLSSILQYRIFRSSPLDPTTANFLPWDARTAQGDPAIFPRQQGTGSGHLAGDPGVSSNYPNGTLDEAGALGPLKLYGNAGPASSQWQPNESHRYTISVYWPRVGEVGSGPSDATDVAASYRAGNKSTWTIHWDATTTVPSGG